MLRFSLHQASVQIQVRRFSDLNNPPLVHLVPYLELRALVQIPVEQGYLAQADRPLSELILVLDRLERPLIREDCLVRLNNLRPNLPLYLDRVAQREVVCSVLPQVRRNN